jgi:CBS domain-containing protein
MNIGEICVREVVICAATATVVDAARLMRERHVGDLVVVEERSNRRFPVGMITDRDITVEVVALNVPLDGLTIGDIMGRNLISVAESEDVFRTLELMRRKSVRRLPVVDRQGALVGIVALDDLLEILAEELTLMVKLIARQPSQEAHSRPMLSPRPVEATP